MIYFVAIVSNISLIVIALINIRQARRIKKLEFQNERLADRLRRAEA
jgi:hypothetical protein